jgi:hypothetical protein
MPKGRRCVNEIPQLMAPNRFRRLLRTVLQQTEYV